MRIRKAAATRIQAALHGVEVPAEIAAAVRAAYAELGGGPVAVRSSATAEDLATRASPGSGTPTSTSGARRHCSPASCGAGRRYGPRGAIDYRARRGVDDPRLAVVVQRMVEAGASGVLFTTDPTTGRRDRIVVSAAWGWASRWSAGSWARTTTSSTGPRSPRWSGGSRTRPR